MLTALDIASGFGIVAFLPRSIASIKFKILFKTKEKMYMLYWNWIDLQKNTHPKIISNAVFAKHTF